VPAITLRPATPADEAFVNRLTRDVMRDYVNATWADDAARERYHMRKARRSCGLVE